jgi:hypothetical protein
MFKPQLAGMYGVRAEFSTLEQSRSLHYTDNHYLYVYLTASVLPGKGGSCELRNFHC